ncbi:MAG: PIN domain-containing protein [Chloroflexi bacterium]|nr:PIN domain-containing protein [Chloroflexota bacterium]
MSLIALLDADVLWPASVRDTLLVAAEHGLFRPAWSYDILGEMANSLKRARPDLDPARIDRTVNQMLEAFPEALVDGYQALIPAMRNHEKDRHALAAAIRVKAAVLVTNSRVHYPGAACAPYEIDVQSADEFLCNLWHLSPANMVAVLRAQASSLRKPPKTVYDVLEKLGHSVPNFAQTANESGLL